MENGPQKAMDVGVQDAAEKALIVPRKGHKRRAGWGRGTVTRQLHGGVRRRRIGSSKSVPWVSGKARTAAQVGPSLWPPTNVAGEYTKTGPWGEADILGHFSFAKWLISVCAGQLL